MRTRLREEEGAADAWGQTISDTRVGERNGVSAAAAGPAYRMGRGESGPHGDGGEAELASEGREGRAGAGLLGPKAEKGIRIK